MSMKWMLSCILWGVLAFGAAAETKGPHGGLTMHVDHHPIEVVLREQEIVFYIDDHDGKPMPTAGVKARVAIQDGGKTTMTITLLPQAPNLLIGKLPRPIEGKALVVFSAAVGGHSLQARFSLP